MGDNELEIIETPGIPHFDWFIKFKIEDREPNSSYMSRNLHLKKILTRSQICEIGSRYAFRRFAVEIDLRQVERMWRKLGTI